MLKEKSLPGQFLTCYNNFNYVTKRISFFFITLMFIRDFFADQRSYRSCNQWRNVLHDRRWSVENCTQMIAKSFWFRPNKRTYILYDIHIINHQIGIYTVNSRRSPLLLACEVLSAILTYIPRRSLNCAREWATFSDMGYIFQM